MRVTTQNGVAGELVSTPDRATFIPDVGPYGPNRVSIQRCIICIGNSTARDGIVIEGFVADDGPEYQGSVWRLVLLDFYPILTPVPALARP